MSNVRFDELELMLMAMFEQPTLKDTIQVLLEVQPLVAEDAEMSALVRSSRGWSWNGISRKNQTRKQGWQRNNGNRYVYDLPDQ